MAENKSLFYDAKEVMEMLDLKNPKDMLMKWNDIAQTEISRKREQYNID